MAPYITSVIKTQENRPSSYAEPFAGGAGAGLKLLVDEVVREIYINDLAPGIAAFWRAVFNRTSELAQQVRTANVTIDEWHKQHKIFANPEDHDDLTLGFATFFMNRANRSGILTARPIGGLEQTGKWKIDARFNRESLAQRIEFLGKYRRRVKISQLDAKEFIERLEKSDQSILVYVDPPYIIQGDDLYLDSLSFEDHKDLASLLQRTSLPWLLTYDITDEITRELYRNFRTARFNIAHTAQKQHIGSEYLLFSQSVHVPNLDVMNGANGEWVSI